MNFITTNLNLVSIIIPTFNRSHLIGETLDSVIKQTYKNWECIVVDDGSTDYTDELMEFYCIEDSRVKYFKRPNTDKKGGNTCRNYGFFLSKGDYIQFLDSDDLLSSNKLRNQIMELSQCNKMSIATCKYGYFDSLYSKFTLREKLNTYKNFQSGIQLLAEFGCSKEYFPSHVYLISKELIEVAGEWNEDLIINQDGEFFSRILLFAEKILFVNSEVYYRVGNEISTSKIDSHEKAQALIYSWQIIEENFNKLLNSKIEHIYISQAKIIIYNKINDKYPSIIRKNYKYFKPIIPFLHRIIYKLF